MHYRNLLPEIVNSQGYNARLSGAKKIIRASIAGFTAGLVISSFIVSPLAALAIGAVIGTLGNISVHWSHNAANPVNPLEFGYAGNLDENQIRLRPRFQTEKLKDFIERLSPKEKRAAAELIRNIHTYYREPVFIKTEIAPLRYQDLMPFELESFENATLYDIMKIANDMKPYSETVMPLAEKMISQLWFQGRNSGNENFEELKYRIQNDIPTEITFICIANQNRSAVSHIIFEDLLKKNGNKNIVVKSAGAGYTDRLSQFYGMKISRNRLDREYSYDLKKNYGVDEDIINSFISEEMTPEHITKADFIIAAENSLLKSIEEMLESAPSLEKKPRVLLYEDIVPNTSDRKATVSMYIDRRKQDELVSTLYAFSKQFFVNNEQTENASDISQGVSDSKLTLPIITAFVVNPLKFFNVNQRTIEKAVAIAELPLTTAAAYIPWFKEIFINWHSGTQEQKDKRDKGIKQIRAAMNAAVKEAVISRFKFIRALQFITFGIAVAINANIKAHVEYNLATRRDNLFIDLQMWDNAAIAGFIYEMDLIGGISDLLFKKEARDFFAKVSKLIENLNEQITEEERSKRIAEYFNTNYDFSLTSSDIESYIAAKTEYKLVLEIYKRQLAKDSVFMSNFNREQFLQDNKIKYKIEDGKTIIEMPDGNGIPLDFILDTIFNGKSQLHRQETDANMQPTKARIVRSFIQFDFKRVLFKDDDERMKALQWVILVLNNSYKPNSLLLPAQRILERFKDFNGGIMDDTVEWQARIENALHYISKDISERGSSGSSETPIRFFSLEKYEQTREIILELDELLSSDSGFLSVLKTGRNGFNLNIFQPNNEDIKITKSKNGKYIYIVGKSASSVVAYTFDIEKNAAHAFYIDNENEVFRFKGIIPNLNPNKDKKHVPQLEAAIIISLIKIIDDSIDSLRKSLARGELDGNTIFDLEEYIYRLKKYQPSNAKIKEYDAFRESLEKIALQDEESIISFAIESKSLYFDSALASIVDNIAKAAEKSLAHANLRKSFIEHLVKGKGWSLPNMSKEQIMQSCIQRILDTNWLDDLASDSDKARKELIYYAFGELDENETKGLLEIIKNMALVQKIALKYLNNPKIKIDKNAPHANNDFIDMLKNEGIVLDRKNRKQINMLVQRLFVHKFDIKRGEYHFQWINETLKKTNNPISFDFGVKKAAVLPATKKIIQERGYKGVIKYLYTGAKELIPFIFKPAAIFARLHTDITQDTQTALAERIKILKIITFSLSIASTAAVLFFFPPIITFAPIFKLALALIGVFAFSTTFFGVIIHGVNNFIEDIRYNMRYKKMQQPFSLFTIEELNGKIADYEIGENISLDSDIGNLLGNGQEIKSLFETTDYYKDGGELKVRVQRLLELYYFRAIEQKNEQLQDSLINLLYGFYKTIDSLDFQEGIIFVIEENKGSTINQAQYEMLKYFYAFNAIALDSDFDGKNYIRRINTQKRIIRYFLSDENPQDLIKIEPKSAEGIQTQISKNAYLEVAHYEPEAYFDFQKSSALSDKQKELFAYISQISMTIPYFLKEIYAVGITREIGYPHIKVLNDKKYLYDDFVLSKTLPAEYKIYALLRAVSMEDNPFSATYRIRGLIARLRAENNKEALISQETESELAVGAEKILNEAQARKISTGDEFLDSLEAEMLFAAAALSLHGKYSDVNLGDFLKQLKYTFVKDGNTQYIINVTGNEQAELFKVNMSVGAEYIKSIKALVETLYQRNKGIQSGIEEKGLTPAVKGYMSLIQSVKRNITMFIIVLALSIANFANLHASPVYAAAMGIPRSFAQTINIYDRNVVDVAKPFIKIISPVNNAAEEFLKNVGQDDAPAGIAWELVNNAGKAELVIKVESLSTPEFKKKISELLTNKLENFKDEASNFLPDDIVVVYKNASEAVITSKEHYIRLSHEANGTNLDIEVFGMDPAEENYFNSNKIKTEILKKQTMSLIRKEEKTKTAIDKTETKQRVTPFALIAASALGIIVLSAFSRAFRKVFGFLKKKITMVILNYSVVKNKSVFEDFARDNAAETNGAIYAEMYIINEMPQDKENFGFKNTGIKIDGKSVWISSKSGSLVVFAQDADFADIEEAVKNENAKITSELASLIKRATGKSVKGKILIDLFNVETGAKKTSYSYDESGNIKASLAAQDANFSGLKDFSASLRDIRNADMAAAVQNIYYFLDNIKTAKDLELCLGDFQNVGNGQIILDYGALQNFLNENQIKEFFKQARLNGVKIIADLRNAQKVSDLKIYLNAGFDGVLTKNADDTLNVYDFALASSEKAFVIEGYLDSRQL
ncbi:MAG: hypothetical protein LBO62_00975, partial [Endomicrobium sp.]|nr:hypothetical protein [Endomicrobium sp.]